jgi:hypothetical protein
MVSTLDLLSAEEVEAVSLADKSAALSLLGCLAISNFACAAKADARAGAEKANARSRAFDDSCLRRTVR